MVRMPRQAAGGILASSGDSPSASSTHGTHASLSRARASLLPVSRASRRRRTEHPALDGEGEERISVGGERAES